MTPRTPLALCLILVAGLALSPPAQGQPAQGQSAQRYYSQGVQAYFHGSSSEAESLLSTALAYSPRDPRAYYFRGLARMRQGRSYEGEQDMRIGAAIEAAWSGRPMALGRTLERVQGGNRLLLERIRREARKSRGMMQSSNQRQRYQQATDRSKQAMRAEFRFPLEAIATANSPDDLAQMVVAQAESSGDPFADDPVEKAPTPVDIPEEARGAMTVRELGSILGNLLGGAGPSDNAIPEPSDEPDFGADPFSADSPADSNDPFGTGPRAPEDPPSRQPAADPFAPADDEQPAEDPFADPFGDSDAADTDTEDPFGDF